MRFLALLLFSVCLVNASLGLSPSEIFPTQERLSNEGTISSRLFSELEELSRIVDIAYCVGITNIGISKPFSCLSRCSEFPNFQLVKTWNTGPLMSDSCGYLALDHSDVNPRIIVAFRGTYSIANAVVDLSTVPQEYVPYPGGDAPDSTKWMPGQSQQVISTAAETPKCDNCTVHSGFYQSWRVTSETIKSDLGTLVATHPDYKLHLVGHSLGGAVAALAGLDFESQGWKPTVTTFGEPRLGNRGLMNYIDNMFNLTTNHTSASNLKSESLQAYKENLAFRRVTHIDDPIPQLPLSEWGFRTHAGEIFISKSELSPEIQDIKHCIGDADPACIAGQDSTLTSSSEDSIAGVVREAALWGSAGGGITIPARYRLWQMLFAHRDYFWRLGLCVPGGGPWGWKNSLDADVEGVE